MLEIKEKISVYVNGVKEFETDSMLDALTYVHECCMDCKVTLKTEKEYKVC